MLKEMSNILKYPLQKLFSLCMHKGEIPDRLTLKIGHITPVFKKRKKCDPSNYRPVSLTSIVYKTMDSLVKEEIVRHLLENDLVTCVRFGTTAVYSLKF